MSVHEFSHALAAYKLGDHTAKYSGRLTLNPLAHIDPLGTLILPLFLFITTRGQFVFGAAKPVPINYSALKNPRRDMALVGLSGPAANFIFALALALLRNNLPDGSLIKYLAENLIGINVVLAVFNLIPLPPLDGSRIISGMLPQKLSSSYALIEPYGFMILMVLVVMGVLDLFIWPAVSIILRLLFTL